MPIVSGGGGGAAGGALTPPVSITNTSAAAVPFTVKAAVGQSGEILEVQSSGGFDYLDIDQIGQVIFRGPASGGNHTFRVRSADNTTAIDVIDDGSGAVDTTKLAGATVDLNPSGELRLRGPAIGFFGGAGVAQPTGVAVTAVGIHAALVSLGLITA